MSFCATVLLFVKVHVWRLFNSTFPLILLPHPYRAIATATVTITATATDNIIGQTIVQSIPEP